MRILLVIPAYNEAECIEAVVDQLVANYPEYDYVVVNDGSTDGTGDVCRQRRYRFIDLPVNLGLAGAFQAGIKYARHRGYDCAVQFDADGQHLPEYVADLAKALERADIAIGSRFLDGGKPRSMRAFGSSLLSSMIRLTTGTTITDPTSGMRAYGKRAIEELACGPNLGPEPDTLAFLMKKKGLKVVEVPVKMAERIAGKSYLGWSNSASYMLRMSFSVLVAQLFR